MGVRWSMRYPMLMQSLMHRSKRIAEGLLQERLVVRLAVMMRRLAGSPLRSAITDVLQAPVDEGQHVVRRLRAEQVVGTAAGQIDRRGMSHDAAPPAIVVLDRGIMRTGAAGAQPGRSCNLERGSQAQFASALLL